MNAVTDISGFRSLGADWDAIFAEVNAWRGACLHHFSAAEMAVTETLLILMAAPKRGETVRLPAPDAVIIRTNPSPSE